jgi:acyl-CoA reductase-like NAD-dependent aldehyde dehydrogenase
MNQVFGGAFVFIALPTYRNSVLLTCSICTNDLATAHRAASAVEAGYVWMNEVGRHFLGTPFGGYKQSGIGREKCLEEPISYTQEKNIYIRLLQPKNAGSALDGSKSS